MTISPLQLLFELTELNSLVNQFEPVLQEQRTIIVKTTKVEKLAAINSDFQDEINKVYRFYKKISKKASTHIENKIILAKDLNLFFQEINKTSIDEDHFIKLLEKISSLIDTLHCFSKPNSYQNMLTLRERMIELQKNAQPSKLSENWWNQFQILK